MRLKTKIVILLLSVFLAALAFNWIANLVYADHTKLVEYSDQKFSAYCIAQVQAERTEWRILQKTIERTFQAISQNFSCE